MVKCTVSRHTSCICKTPPSQCSCFILTSHPCTHQTLAVLGFVGNKREDQDCIQGLELSFFTNTIDKVHVHKNGQTIYVQYFSSHNIKKKKKEKPEGCQLLYLLIPCPLMYSSLVRCFVANICFTDVWKGTSDAPQILIQMHRHSRSMSKLERNDENIFITRLWWSSPQAAWSVRIFSSLEQDVLYVFYIFLHFNLRSVRMS